MYNAHVQKGKYQKLENLFINIRINIPLRYVIFIFQILKDQI
jgi:hypothetical protein